MQVEQKISKLPFANSFEPEARRQRVNYLAEQGHRLTTYQNSELGQAQVQSNVEAFLGTMSIPVGLVGPLIYTGEGKIEKVFAAAATTEGALVASMNRGVSAINKAGGFKAFVAKQTMLRAPVFEFENMDQAVIFKRWVEQKKEFFGVYIKRYSQHANLEKIVSSVWGKSVELKFYYQTGDAAGQNMTTTCTWQCCLWIESEFAKENDFEVKEFVLEGNGASDKKVSYDAAINGRGVDVTAECILDEYTIRKVLKTTSEDILKWHHRSRSVINHHGMMGDNINVANALAALFTACGQDIACVHESSIGYLYFEKHSRGLYVSLRLPKLVIGTIGGGTGLPSQKENLGLMGCYGVGKVKRFAELLAGFCLGLELSTISAMVSGQFAIAHEKLGRNKPVDFLLQDNHLESFLNSKLMKGPNSYMQFQDNYFDSNGIVTKLTAQNAKKFLGLSLWQINQRGEQSLALLKSKPTDNETLNCMYILTGMVNPELAKIFNKEKLSTDFANAHLKEIQIYEKLKGGAIPHIYGTYVDGAREIYLVLMEFLNSAQFKIMNSEDTPSVWSYEDYQLVLNQHFKTLLSVQEIKVVENPPPSDHRFAFQALDVLKLEYPHGFEEFFEIYAKCLELIKDQANKDYESLIHNDFNPRNIAVDKNNRVVVYDWELAKNGLPQRDQLELLSFILDGPLNQENLSDLILDGHRIFSSLSNHMISSDQWLADARLALADYIVNRLSLYLLGNKLTRYSFIKRVIMNTTLIARELKI